jgi:L-fucose isomerase
MDAGINVAIAHLADGRPEFFTRRESLVNEELATLDWLRQEFELIESGIIVSSQGISDFAQKVAKSRAQSLIIHLPIWADPVFSVKLNNQVALPTLLLGNERPDTSSIVGMLGAGGALDQIGSMHTRIFEHNSHESRRAVIAFARAAATRSKLRGQTFGQFGGRSLGIVTTVADPAQWMQLFGVDIETFDQMEIVEVARNLPADEVQRHMSWLVNRVACVEYGGKFTSTALERQVRSYIATKKLIEKYQLDFIGVKCQSELSDGYVSQCVAHMLTNGSLDVEGQKSPVVHACESDADGALTMQVLHLLSGGKPAALLDVRWFDRKNGTWTLANCGAIAADFAATDSDPSGLSNVAVVPHIFGQGGGGALASMASPQPVTLARLCRKSGEYWMAILSGEVVERNKDELQRTTSVFPQAFVKTSAGIDFANNFGSNHIHMVSGNYVEELVNFCRQVGIPWQIWNS